LKNCLGLGIHDTDTRGGALDHVVVCSVVAVFTWGICLAFISCFRICVARRTRKREIMGHSEELYHAIQAVEDNCLGCVTSIVMEYGGVLPPLTVSGQYSLRDWCAFSNRPEIDAYLKEKKFLYHGYSEEGAAAAYAKHAMGL
jgi:hypothetical protein